MAYVDFHCDTLMAAFCEKKEEIGTFPGKSIDIDRLCRGGAGAQFFAAFVPPVENKEWWENHEADLILEGIRTERSRFCLGLEDNYIKSLKRILDQTTARYSDDMVLVNSGESLEAAAAHGKLAAFFSIEDGRSIDGNLDKLEMYKNMGVSLITLTWNYENCLGFPNSRDTSIMQQGLKEFGKEAVEAMNDLGIVVDVSHLSDGGFWDVAAISKKPFIASHSNCRALSPHSRNLTDEMLKKLAEKGGVTGLNFCAAFLNEDIEYNDSMISDMVRHILHMINVGGLECAAIGTDFDGIGSRLEIESPLCMERLFGALEKAGLSQDAIEKVAWGNAYRVLRDIL